MIVSFDGFIFVVHLLSHAQLLATPWTAACQASLFFMISQSLLRLISIEPVMQSNHLILVTPFSSCLQSFPVSGSFPMSQFFASCGHIIGVSASASVLPVNNQDWFPLGWTGMISLLSKGLLRVFIFISCYYFFISLLVYSEYFERPVSIYYT